MKRLIAALLLMFLFVACTADYDTFGTSDYKNLKDLRFEEQDGNSSIYESEHLINVSMKARENDSDDSVTIETLSLSSLATLHLVDDEIDEFPEDSVALDSLAELLSYSKKRLREGDKICVPSDLQVFLMVVSESGLASVWQVKFTYPEKPSSSSALSSSSSKPASSSSSLKSDVSSSSSKPTASSSSSKTESSSSSSSSGDSENSKSPLPRILSMKIDGHEAVIDSVEENGSMVFWIHYDHLEFLADLTNLSVSDIVLTENAEVSEVAEGENYDLEKGIFVTVKNPEGESLRYEIRAGYQYPSMNIESSDWTKDDNGNLYDLKGWDNGNNSFTKELAVSAESGEVLKMQTTKYAGKIASGNTFTAYFNPKNINAISMLSYKDGNELIDFGRPFYGRPRYVEFDAKYEGKGDSCDLYLLLESRMTANGEVRTAEEGKNQYRSSSDVNTLVASAWYRATTVDSDEDPDVVSIYDAAREGFKTIRMKLSYGIPLENSPLYQSSVFASGLKNSAGIDNHLEKTDSPDDFKVTHIRIVMASSAEGNVYKGEKDAILLVDGIRLIY